MLPQYDSSTEQDNKPSIGSFPTVKPRALQDSLAQIIQNRLSQTIPENASIADGEKISAEKLEAQRLLAEMTYRPKEETQTEKTELKPTPIGAEIKPSNAETRRETMIKELLEAMSKQADDIKQLKEELAVLKKEEDNSGVSTINNSSPEITHIEQLKESASQIENSNFTHIPQSEESLASRGNLLPDFSSGEISQPKIIETTAPSVITSEMIRVMPSEMPDKRILRMPKNITKRETLVNGKTHAERMATLLKKETSPDDLIDVVLEKVSDKLPSIDTTMERFQAYDYQRIGELVEKLKGVDAKKYILKIFSPSTTLGGTQ